VIRVIQKRRIKFGVFSSFVKAEGGAAKVVAILGIGAAVVVASVLAFAGSGNAAGKNICTVPGLAASCVTVRSAPHFITAANAASETTAPVAITKFVNQAGNGGSTATHVVVSTAFSSPVDVKSIALAINGTPGADVSLCTPNQATTGVTRVSCPVGSVSGGGSVKLTVRYTTTLGVTLTGQASYGESKPSGQPTNSQQVNSDILTISDGTSGGGCFDSGTNIVTGSTAAQTTEATVGQGVNGDLPCTFADAGVQPNADAAPSAKLKTQISFFEFPTFGTGNYATVRMLVTPLPTGVKLNSAIVREDTNYAKPFFQTWVTVPACNKDGSIPGPVGIPAKGDTDSTPNHGNDLCIFNRSPLQGGGGEFDLHAFGSPPDGHVGI